MKDNVSNPVYAAENQANVKPKSLKISSQEWLNDLHINLFINDYSMRYPDILFIDPLVLNSSKKLAINSKQLVFIIFCQNHWITVTKKENCNEWIVYDSMNNTKNIKHIQNILEKIEGIGQCIHLNLVKVQDQININDCGLFSIAFSISICLGKDPSKIFYFQSKMRDHFNECVESGYFLDFPSIGIDIKEEINKIKIYI